MGNALYDGPGYWNETRGTVGSQVAEHYLFHGHVTGTHLRPNHVVDEFKKILKKEGLPAIRFHDSRHSTATLLLGLGVHAKVIQEETTSLKTGSSAKLMKNECSPVELSLEHAQSQQQIVDRTDDDGCHPEGHGDQRGDAPAHNGEHPGHHADRGPSAHEQEGHLRQVARSPEPFLWHHASFKLSHLLATA